MSQSLRRSILELDGRTGEGGGQLVRIAVGLSALTGIPVRVHHVRGNRRGARGGGLKSQHAACIEYLAEATNAEVVNCYVGSTSFEFHPRRSPLDLATRNIHIKTESAACIQLILQSVLPFLLYAGHENQTPISLTINGGTNVSFSLSYEYLDQVLLPSLEALGIPKIDRKLNSRGWNLGTKQLGSVTFKFQPLKPGEILQTQWAFPKQLGPIARITLSLIAPMEMLDSARSTIEQELCALFPRSTFRTAVEEDSGHPTRIYALLLAETSYGQKIAGDYIYSQRARQKTYKELAVEVSSRVVSSLRKELDRGGTVDEHLQDQLIIFQALGQGRTSINVAPPRRAQKLELDDASEPFGEGSLHAQTARWVVSQFLPNVQFFDNGATCEGVGFLTDLSRRDA